MSNFKLFSFRSSGFYKPENIKNPEKNDHSNIPDSQRNYEKRTKRRAIRTLHSVIRKNDVSAVINLLTPDLDVDFHYGAETALQIAVNEGLHDICQILINRGADVNKTKADGNTLLNMAAWHGFSDITQLLVSNGANVNISNNKDSSPLNTAAYKGFTDVAKTLVGANCDMNIINCYGLSALGTCAKYNSIGVATILIEHSCDINIPDKNDKSPLITAVEARHSQMVRLLINSGCDLNIKDAFGSTALFCASKSGDNEILRILLEAGADFDICNNKRVSPILEAVQYHHSKIVSMLLDYGCDVDIPELELSLTAIHAAVQQASYYFDDGKSTIETVEILLKHGCALNAIDNNKWTPLHKSALAGEAEITKMLLEYGANVEQRTEHGDTPLHMAAVGNDLDIIKMLLKAGCDANAVNHNNETVLYRAVSHRANYNVINLLIESGIDVNICEQKCSQSPLNIAVRHEYTEAVKLLMNAGANINSSDLDGGTPLYWACSNGNDVIVSLLLQSPDIIINDEMKKIPLHTATADGYMNIVSILLEHGANVNQANDLGETALMHASVRNDVSLVHVLLRNGAIPTFSKLAPKGKCCKMFHDYHPHLGVDPLYYAAQNNNLIIANLLISASPRLPYTILYKLSNLVWQTDFIINARIASKSVTNYADFFSNTLSQIRTLKEECKGVIIESLCCNKASKCSTLPIPKQLQRFISMCSI